MQNSRDANSIISIALLLALLLAPSAQGVGWIMAWGSNEWGQCDIPEPNMGFTAIDCIGLHSLGLRLDGSIEAWGSNQFGQCNIPEPNDSFIAVACGWEHSLGLKADGSLVAWGSNEYGQCEIPEPNSDFIAIGSGGDHNLGLKSDGSIVAWGRNDLGQCSVPDPNLDFVAVDGGVQFSMGLKSTGSIVAWGSNGSGQCEIPEPNESFIKIASGSAHGLALRANGTVEAWGWNENGQCDVPEPNSDFLEISASPTHSLGLNANWSIEAWGWNENGQCDVPTPNEGYVAVAASWRHSLGIMADGRPLIHTIEDVQSDQGGRVRLRWHRSDYDAHNMPYLITDYAIWRRVEDRNGTHIDSEIVSSTIDDREYPPGNWDFVQTVPARGEDLYSVIAPTLCDSTEAGICWSTFFVSALTPDPLVYFDSHPDSGYSVDNIPPGVPEGFIVQYLAEGNTLVWDPSGDEDFQYFKIYRGDADDFEVSDETLAHQTIDTGWVDTGYGFGWYYKISAVDYAGNEGEATAPGYVTGMNVQEVSEKVALFPCVPNPFNPSTTIRYSLPAAGQVSLVVYDLAGRKVADLVAGPMLAGVHEVVWGGRNSQGQPVVSGVYLYMLETEGLSQTRKMILLK